MAEREVGSDVSEELTRESLIALSYSLPDTELAATDQPKITVEKVTEAINTDGNDKVRSDLISIAYAESPDIKDSPVSPKKTKG